MFTCLWPLLFLRVPFEFLFQCVCVIVCVCCALKRPLCGYCQRLVMYATMSMCDADGTPVEMFFEREWWERARLPLSCRCVQPTLHLVCLPPRLFIGPATLVDLDPTHDFCRLFKLNERLTKQYGKGCMEAFPQKSLLYMKPEQVCPSNMRTAHHITHGH